MGYMQYRIYMKVTWYDLNEVVDLTECPKDIS